MSEKDDKSPFKPFEAGLELSKKLIDWALLILGGSIALLLGTSHAAPAHPGLRLVYLLFPIGWGFLMASMYFGVHGQQAYLSLHFRPEPETEPEKKKRIEQAKKNLTQDTYQQIRALKVGLFVFALWLTLYLVWWMAGVELKSAK